jgi:archaellum component FlaF (FlaF/FlaG flagellin family)
VGQIHAETCKFNIYVWVRGDFNGLNISKVKVLGHGEIVTPSEKTRLKSPGKTMSNQVLMSCLHYL